MKKQFLDNLISQAGAALIAYRRIKPEWDYSHYVGHNTYLGICYFTDPNFYLNELCQVLGIVTGSMGGNYLCPTPFSYIDWRAGTRAGYAEAILPRIEYLELILEEAHKIKRTIK